jgi:hypothetical protein
MSERVVLLDRTDYIVEYHTVEVDDGPPMTFVHLDVFFFSPSVLRDMRKTWPAVFSALNAPAVFCVGDVDDAKFHRFVTRFGWRYLKPLPCTDNKTRRLYVHFGPTKEAQQEQ